MTQRDQQRGGNGDPEHEHGPATVPRTRVRSGYDAAIRAMTDEVLFEVAGGVARVTINRPERRNAMSYGVMHGLRDAMARAPSRRRRCASWCSPARATRRSARAPTSRGIAENAGAAAAHEGRGLLADLFRDMWSLGKPIVARVRGYALAGGFGLACACDMIVAADDAVFGTPEINVGLWPYMITVPLLRSMPPKTALDLMMTGPARRRRGRRAHRVRAAGRAGRRARRDGRRARRRARGEVAADHAAGAATRSTGCSRWTPTPRSRTSRAC